MIDYFKVGIGEGMGLSGKTLPVRYMNAIGEASDISPLKPAAFSELGKISKSSETCRVFGTWKKFPKHFLTWEKAPVWP